ITVSCEAGCSLDGTKVHLVTGPSETEYQLVSEEGGAGAAIAFDAPHTVGEHVWRVSFPAQTIDGIAHQGSELCVPIKTRAHQSSLAVWSIPSPVLASSRFAIKVGAKSSADCELRDQKVQVC